MCVRVGRGTNIGHIGSHNLKVAREEKTGKMLIKLQEGYGEMSVYGLSKLTRQMDERRAQ